MKNMENYKIVFQDYWNIFKRYSNIENTDEYWKSFSDEINKAYVRHGKVPISSSLGLMVMEEIERVHNQIYRWKNDGK